MANKLYDEFYWKRKELQRLRGIYNKRVKRAKAQGLYDATYLSTIKPQQLGLNDKGEDLFNIDEFNEASTQKKEEYIKKIKGRINALESKLANKTSSVRGLKEIIKRDKGLKNYPTAQDMKSKDVNAILKRHAENPENYFKHELVQEIMDTIDAYSDLTKEEKETLKKYIRRRLNRKERVDYDDKLLEWDFNVEDILNNPQYFVQQLKQEIPQEELLKLQQAAAKLAERNNNTLPF